MRQSRFHRLYQVPGLHRPSALVLVPSLIVLAGVLLTMLAFRTERANEQVSADAHLKAIVERTEAAVIERFQTYEDALVAGTALFAASNSVSADQWRSFTRTLDLTNRYPGVNGIGVIFPVKRADAASFELSARASVDPAFSIRRLDSVPQYDDLFIMTYLEPLEGNEAARGLDMGSEPKRRSAIEAARDSGTTAVTGVITLVQDQKSRPGFLVYVPFYRPGALLETTAQRREALVGFVYAPFVAENFLAGVVSSAAGEAELQVFDKAADLTDVRLYGDGPALEASRADSATEVTLAGQSFELRFRRGGSFSSGLYSANWIVAAGVLVTAALTVVMIALMLAARSSLGRAVYAEQTALHRGDLVDLASHELRNPLAILSLAAEMLEAEASVLGELSLQESAAAARAAAGRAEALVSELLDLSRMDAQRLHLALGPVRLEPAIDDAIALTSSHWGDRPVNRTGPALGEGLVIADPGRLDIVLRNMVDNAFKYSPEGTPVSIAVEAERDDEVAVTVSDEGPGIPVADRTAVFDRFRRGEATANVGGLGIGLHLSRELARRMGGELTLLPGALGQGARFRLVLRAAAGLGVVRV